MITIWKEKKISIENNYIFQIFIVMNENEVTINVENIYISENVDESPIINILIKITRKPKQMKLTPNALLVTPVHHIRYLQIFFCWT